MPCSTGQGDPGAVANAAHWKAQTVEQRVAKLEAALCGMLKILPLTEKEMHPDLRAWWKDHQAHPGHRP